MKQKALQTQANEAHLQRAFKVLHKRVLLKRSPGIDGLLVEWEAKFGPYVEEIVRREKKTKTAGKSK